MKNSRLEEMLLEIEKRTPFQNDNDMRQAIEKIMAKERKKRTSKQDFDLIDECVEALLILKGYDIDKVNEYIQKTNEEALERIHEKIRLEQSKTTTKARIIPKRYRVAFITVCIIAMLILTSTVAYTLGFEPLRNIISELFGIPVGESISHDGATYVRGGEVVYYDTVEKLLDEQQLTMLYPSYLSRDMKLNKIGVSALSNNGSKITFEFSCDEFMYIMYNYKLFDFKTFDGQIPTYISNNIVYYILEETSGYTVYFEYKDLQYTLQYNDYSELIKILDNMKEYK